MNVETRIQYGVAEHRKRMALAAKVRCPECGGETVCSEHYFFDLDEIAIACFAECRIFTVLGADKWIKYPPLHAMSFKEWNADYRALAQMVHDQRKRLEVQAAVDPGMLYHPKQETWHDREPML